jgi:hypothetical protein
VLVEVVSVRRTEASPVLETTVHGFMARSNPLLCFLVHPRNIVIRSPNGACFTSIASVGLDFLARGKYLLQPLSKDLEVRPSSTGEWSIDPDNISCLNANSNLITQSSSPELVGEPLLVERLRLPDLNVGAINRNFARLSLITPELIAPTNL